MDVSVSQLLRDPILSITKDYAVRCYEMQILRRERKPCALYPWLETMLLSLSLPVGWTKRIIQPETIPPSLPACLHPWWHIATALLFCLWIISVLVTPTHSQSVRSCWHKEDV